MDAGKIAGLQDLPSVRDPAFLPQAVEQEKEDRMEIAANSSVVMPLPEFERVVCRSGMRVWDRCRRVRDHRGFVDSTYRKLASLAGFESIPAWRVRQGIHRLHRIGLAKFVFDKETKTMRRWVDGEKRTKRGNPVVILSSVVAEHLKSADSWGGRRPNAGRKKIQLESNQDVPKSDNLKQNPESRCTNIESRCTAENKSRCTNPESLEPENNQSSRTDSSHTRTRAGTRARDEQSLNPLPSFPLREREEKGSGAADRAGSCFSFFQGRTEPKPELESELDGILNSGDRQEKSGCIFWTHPAVPPYPKTETIRVPPPPMINPHTSPDDRFIHIASTWMKAFEARYGGRCFTFAKAMRDPKKSKFRGIVVGAAEQFIKHEIAPAAWIAFSFDVWHEYGNHPETDPPPVPWVLRPERVHERRGWFRREAARYRGGRVLYSRVQRELVRRYSSMQAALARLPINTSDADVKKTVGEFFPDNTYEDLIEKANVIAKDVQSEINECLRRGDWLWSDDWQIRE